MRRQCRPRPRLPTSNVCFYWWQAKQPARALVASTVLAFASPSRTCPFAARLSTSQQPSIVLCSSTNLDFCWKGQGEARIRGAFLGSHAGAGAYRWLSLRRVDWFLGSTADLGKVAEMLTAKRGSIAAALPLTSIAVWERGWVNGRAAGEQMGDNNSGVLWGERRRRRGQVRQLKRRRRALVVAAIYWSFGGWADRTSRKCACFGWLLVPGPEESPRAWILALHSPMENECMPPACSLKFVRCPLVQPPFVC
ncbi:hypothetical protein P154DRAFT_84192 [Amniculicola lignicola CBS 123094]|uniref:Uncharacterized protein n=1 Tax=Amniculicola lignicola CBS 123094 TaxID=1392246 RepID=A0A6A5X0K1_9PLEO|nr:hypothetical protein P154DRAFT_84192 [Amniculicola lignicola CBS 123094]